MKSSDAKKPKFDSAWWKKNKSSKADPKDKVATALKKYAEQKTKFFKDPRLEDLLDTLKEVKTAAEAEAKTLGAMQKDSKEALTNYAKLADKATKDLKGILKTPMQNIDVETLVKNVPQFKKFCEKRWTSESYNFLSLMYKKPVPERQWYEVFIKEGGKFQANVGGKHPQGV